MLEQEGIYNDLSPELRDKLVEKVTSFGKIVRYKFNLARENPDREKYNGKFIYPAQYNLDPVQFKITDPYEKRPNKQASKNIGIIESLQKNERGNDEYRYARVRVLDTDRGEKYFDMTKPEDVTQVAYLELHPKNGSGMFTSTNMISMFSRIDDLKEATQKRTERSEKRKALEAIEDMDEAAVLEFADAMSWNSALSPEIIRNQMEELAETTPKMFNNLISDKKLKIQATVKRAIDNRVLGYNPVDGSLTWDSTGQQIVVLGQNTGEKTDVERFAEWFVTNGKKADETYKKLESLSKKPVTA